MGEMFDIFLRHGAAGGHDLVADLQFGQRLAERMAFVTYRRAFDPAACNGGQKLRSALNGGALHIVHDTTHTAHFFTAACTTGAAMDEACQRRTVARR